MAQHEENVTRPGWGFGTALIAINVILFTAAVVSVVIYALTFLVRPGESRLPSSGERYGFAGYAQPGAR